MKKNNRLLLVSLLLMPVIVFAKIEETMPIAVAIFMEAFITIHMSLMVLRPLSEIFTKDAVSAKKLFWKLFFLRVGFLLFCDIFITPSVAFVDFFAVFAGIFLVIIASAIKGVVPGGITKASSSSNNNIVEEKAMNSNDKVIISGDNNSDALKPASISDFDPMYLSSEELLLQTFIEKEAEKAGFKINSDLLPEAVIKRKKILSIIFSILIFVYISIIFIHFPIYTYIIGLIILVVFYFTTNGYDAMDYIKKEVKARPNEKISNIVMTVKTTSSGDNSKVFRKLCLLVGIVLPFIIFMTPKIIYEKVDNGYAVRYYMFGVTNFKTVTIPDSYKGEKIVSLRGNTFSNMPFLEKVTLPDSITEIRGQAFRNDKKLVSVNMPEQLEYIGGGAFYKCTSIKEVSFSDNVTYMGGEIFYGASSLERVRLSNQLSEIRGDSFEYCTSLRSIEIPDSVTRIGGHAFYGDSLLKEVKLTENSELLEIGSSAFRQCHMLDSITIPTFTSVNERAFKESPTVVYRFGGMTVEEEQEILNNNNNTNTNSSFNYFSTKNARYNINEKQGVIFTDYNLIVDYLSKDNNNLKLRVKRGDASEEFTFNTSSEFEVNYLFLDSVINIDNNYSSGVKVTVNKMTNLPKGYNYSVSIAPDDRYRNMKILAKGKSLKYALDSSSMGNNNSRELVIKLQGDINQTVTLNGDNPEFKSGNYYIKTNNNQNIYNVVGYIYIK